MCRVILECLLSVIVVQVSTGKKRGVAGPQEAAQLALMCLRRAQQLQPSDTCQALKQECDVYNKLHDLQPSTSHAEDLERCHRVLRKLCV